MRHLSIYLLALFSISIYSCKNENESKYRKTTENSFVDTSFLKGQLAYYSFENGLAGIDSNANSLPLAFAGNNLNLVEGCSSKSLKALHLTGNEFIQFSSYTNDTLVFTFSVKSDAKLTSNKNIILDINKKANIGLDGVTGPTYLATNGISQKECINSWAQWVFVSVSILKKEGKVVVTLINELDGNTNTYTYNLTLSNNLTDYEPIRIGASFVNGEKCFIGSVDNIRIFNRLLSKLELDNLSKQ